ncbi:MAG TPA: heme exporter protein CcmB [Burkholderiaceae bacterium]|jgi:heme exporter protein B|nr:heme exporter protein CcmB [Burkholderiaceae bacterium]
MIRALLAVVNRDLLLARRQRGDVVNVLLFFIIVITMFPLGVGPDKDTLRLIAPGIVWVAALLAAILSLGRLFALDYADGTLEQIMLSGQPLSLAVLGKITAHWLMTGAPITVLSAAAAIVFDMAPGPTATLVASLLLGTPSLSLVGAVGAALTLGLRGAGVLVTLLVLPLYVPVLIFGALAVDRSVGGLSAAPWLMVLGALSLGAAALAPWAIGAALRVSVE